MLAGTGGTFAGIAGLIAHVTAASPDRSGVLLPRRRERPWRSAVISVEKDDVFRGCSSVSRARRPHDHTPARRRRGSSSSALTAAMGRRCTRMQQRPFIGTLSCRFKFSPSQEPADSPPIPRPSPSFQRGRSSRPRRATGATEAGMARRRALVRYTCNASDAVSVAQGWCRGMTGRPAVSLLEQRHMKRAEQVEMLRGEAAHAQPGGLPRFAQNLSQLAAPSRDRFPHVPSPEQASPPAHPDQLRAISGAPYPCHQTRRTHLISAFPPGAHVPQQASARDCSHTRDAKRAWDETTALRKRGGGGRSSCTH